MFHSSIHLRSIHRNFDTVCGTFCWGVSHFNLIDNEEVYSPSFGFTKLRWDISFENVYKSNEDDKDYMFKISLRLFKSTDDSVMECITSILNKDLNVYKSQHCDLDCNPSYKTYSACFSVPKSEVKALYFGKKLVIQCKIVVKNPPYIKANNGEMCEILIKNSTNVKEDNNGEVAEILVKSPSISKNDGKICIMKSPINVTSDNDGEISKFLMSNSGDNDAEVSESIMKIPANVQYDNDKDTSGNLVKNQACVNNDNGKGLSELLVKCLADFEDNNDEEMCEDCKSFDDMLAEKVDFIIFDDAKHDVKRKRRSVLDISTSFLRWSRNALSTTCSFFRDLPRWFMQTVMIEYHQFRVLLHNLAENPFSMENLKILIIIFELILLISILFFIMFDLLMSSLCKLFSLAYSVLRHI